MIGFFTRYTFGDEPLVVLNTFTMGAWATGLTMAIALEARGMVKATGPHLDKMLDTMGELGPGYRYLVVGYPPFLKLLARRGRRARLGLGAYDDAGAAGRRGQLGGAARLPAAPLPHGLSGYGATDVEIGMAAETPVTIALRRLARERAEVSEPLFGSADRSPWSSSTTRSSTTSRPTPAASCCTPSAAHGTLLPKVRYNPHDEGGVLRDDDLRPASPRSGSRRRSWPPPASAA